METINQAVNIAGSQTNLARKLGITPQAVQKWCSGKTVVPIARAVQIEKALNGKITRACLRPDIFGELTDAHSSAIEVA